MTSGYIIMFRKTKILIFFLFCLLSAAMLYLGVNMKKNNNDNRMLVYGMGTDGWGPLFPSQQSSLYGAMIISHVYDSLVGVDSTGGFMPNLAKAWKINKDCTVYTFNIDNERSFSDGSKLTAQVYKDSLLHSLKLEAAASNQSALDVLYALKGFSKYESTGDIEGLEVVGDNILKLHFDKPYRRAIDQLSGTRYGAFIIKNGEYLGTGPYIYVKAEDGLVELAPNPYYPHKLPIKRVKITSDGLKALYDGTIDIAFATPLTSDNKGKEVNSSFEKLSSLLSVHWGVIVNGMKGKIFSDSNLRKAVQYIIYNDFINNYNKSTNLPFFSPDPQFYPPLLQGHLNNSEVRALLDQGKIYINKLREISQDRPIVCVRRASNITRTFDYCASLNDIGIRTDTKNGSFADIKEILYKKYDADLIGFGIAYASADPDGIYHFLGKNGAIWSPTSSRKKVENLIEEGRSIVDQDNLHEHYKKVSRTMIQEVPMIHLGSQYLYLEYNADIIEPTESILAKRKALNVTLFQWR